MTLVRTRFPVLAALALAASGLSAQQTGTITGTVVEDVSNQPMPSVQVFLPGLSLGSLTNAQGRFLIVNVPVGEHELRAEAIGHEAISQRVQVSAGAPVSVNFRLVSRAINMGEIVVTGVAAATPRAQLAFTVDQVKAAELQHVPAVSAGNLLQGKVAGASVVMGSGQPGSEPSIQFRGPTSITGSQAPLIIVDGVVSRGSLADIDPLDIATIEVVKGAGAASLYGSRAQAGVIQITTKRGTAMQAGRTEVIVRNTFTQNSLEHVLGSARSHQYRMTPDGSAFIGRNGQPVKLPALKSQLVFDDGGLGTDPFKAFSDKPFPEPTYDTWRMFYNPGGSNSTFVSVGGNEGRTQYQVSARYTKEEGAVQFNDGLRQRNVRLNVDHRLSDDISLALSSYFTDVSSDQILEGGDGIFRSIGYMTPNANLYATDSTGAISIIGDPFGYQTNPLYDMAHGVQDKRHSQRLMGGIDVTYSPLSWLSIQGNASYDHTNLNKFYYQPYGLARIQGAGLGPPRLGSMRESEEHDADLNGSWTVSLTGNFGALATRTRFRWLVERRDIDQFSAAGSNLLVTETPRLGLLTSAINIDSFDQSVRSEGLFAITALTYQERYIVDLLARRDGSSLFGADERWQNYYRGAFAWRMAQEPWWPFAWIQEFKPRYSIGTAGGRPSFAAQYQTYAVKEGSIAPRVLGNSKLKPEHATERELGLDAVIADRLRIQANWVNTEVSDQLLLVPLPAFAGFESQWQNAGTLKSKTWELEAETALKETPTLQWTMRVNASHTSQRVTKLSVPAFRLETYRAGIWVREGEVLGSFYGMKWAVDCKVDLPAGTDCSQFQVNDDGLLVWVGKNGDYRDGKAKNLWGTSTIMNGQKYFYGIQIRSILDNSLTWMGNTQPSLNASVFHNVQWKNLGFSMLLDGSFGGKIYNQSRAFVCQNYLCPEADQRLKPDELKKPINTYGATVGFYLANENNSWFIEDGTYVKLREVSLRYTLNQNSLPSFFGKVGLSRATLNLTGRNLRTFTSYSGTDPEVGQDQFLGSSVIGRIDEYSYPNFRSVGIDLELVF